MPGNSKTLASIGRGLAVGGLHAAEPADEVHRAIAAALRDFRTEAPWGWSFTQTTISGRRSTAERCDPARPGIARWTLLKKDGMPPTDEERRDYSAGRSRRGTAPRLAQQFDLTTLEIVTRDAERARARCQLRPAEPGDRVASLLLATVDWHLTAQAITRIELRSTREFSPTFGVRIAEMSTVMTYSPPKDGRPSLPAAVETRVRGRAFLLKSLDEEMRIEFSDYAWAGRTARP